MIELKPELIKIGETYLKFDYEFSESNKSLIKEIYLSHIKESSREYLKHSEYFKISIEYDEGSLKTRIVIWGTAIYMGIANYGSFRAGVRELVNDSKFFSKHVIERFDNNINPNDIIRTEKRNGLPGRVQDVYDRIDKLERNVNDLSNNEIQQELQKIKQEISNLNEVLPNQDSQAFLDDLDDDYKRNLPLPNHKRTHYLVSRYGLKPDNEIEFIEE